MGDADDAGDAADLANDPLLVKIAVSFKARSWESFSLLGVSMSSVLHAIAVQ